MNSRCRNMAHDFLPSCKSVYFLRSNETLEIIFDFGGIRDTEGVFFS